MSPFRLAINMPGAISAGAYTAGALDFLIEALDAWYEAKGRGDFVPLHEVSIEAFTGASAGGMCAAISAVLLQDKFEHVSDAGKTGTTNRLYESWVNCIDMRELLRTDDLTGSSEPLTSLLNSSIIETIARSALKRGEPLPSARAYVSRKLTLFLSLTNLRGVPYSLNGVAPDSVEQTTFFFGDRIRFETRASTADGPVATAAHAIDLFASDGDPGWGLLRSAAMATGAFPLFLAPRAMWRDQREYTPPLWESRGSAAQGTPPPLSPTFPVGMADPFETLNVDGGVTNNDPSNYAHDFLATFEPLPLGGELEKKAEKVDRAVLTIAPFPTTEGYPRTFDARANASILWALPRLFAALISQSRFFGEALSGLMSGTTFSSFIVAPSDDALARENKGEAAQGVPPALQCATLGAFGGFFERGFRAHDYALGRRNCQKFLRDHFILPVENPTIAAALPVDPARRAALTEAFGRCAPKGQGGGAWMPIIPLCGPVVNEPIAEVPRFRMRRKKLHEMVKLILKRFRGVMTALLDPIPSLPLRIFLKIGQPAIVLLARRPLQEALIRQLGDSVEE